MSDASDPRFRHDIPPPRPVTSNQGGASNGIGTAGFVVSIVGLLCTLGFLCPVGAVLSTVGVRREPRGLALAGLVIGIVGTLLAAGVCVFCWLTYVVAKKVVREGGEILAPIVADLETGASLGSAQQLIVLEQIDKGRLPSAEKGNALIVGLKDVHGTQLRYEPWKGDRGFTIRSAGEDAKFDTFDDVKSDTILK